VRFTAIADIYAEWGYQEAGTTFDAPLGWMPPGGGGVDPVDGEALLAYHAAGPGFQTGAEPNRAIYPWGWAKWSGRAYAGAKHRWYPIGNGNYLLSGAENLGPR
jgi:hypothetical protein